MGKYITDLKELEWIDIGEDSGKTPGITYISDSLLPLRLCIKRKTEPHFITGWNFFCGICGISEAIGPTTTDKQEFINGVNVLLDIFEEYKGDAKLACWWWVHDKYLSRTFGDRRPRACIAGGGQSYCESCVFCGSNPAMGIKQFCGNNKSGL